MSAIVERDVPLAPKTSFELGGAARYYVEVTDHQQLADALEFASKQELPVTVLGGGSNIVVSDQGVDGLVIAMRTREIVRREEQGDVVFYSAAAGEPWDDFVALTVSEGLWGLECLSGIPGLVGATPIQNVGAYGVETSNRVLGVFAYDRSEKRFAQLTVTDCAFGYRDSMFKRVPNRYIVLAVSYRLLRKAPRSPRYAELERALAVKSHEPDVATVRETVLALRRAKSMVIDESDVNRRSAGSFFLNPMVTRDDATRLLALHANMPHFVQDDGRVKLAAGWLIEKSGIQKGIVRGHVGVSTNHALALVHHGGGTTAELIALAREVRESVRAAFGITLTAEPVFLGYDAPPL